MFDIDLVLRLNEILCRDSVISAQFPGIAPPPFFILFFPIWFNEYQVYDSVSQLIKYISIQEMKTRNFITHVITHFITHNILHDV